MLVEALRYHAQRPLLKKIFFAGILVWCSGGKEAAHAQSVPSRSLASPQEMPVQTQVVDPQWGHTPPLEGNATILHGLDKITARVFSMEAKHGQMIKFGTLRIVVRGCKKNPPEEQPESAAFLEIHEEKPGEQKTTLFTGWMFASSPAVSALEHPVYDIWVTDCVTGPVQDARNASSSSAPAE